jgi:prepilin-type N-terminal cleavage/methylation domain-containing protein/prepilin-type processing-associated H-X9-DG protein
MKDGLENVRSHKGLIPAASGRPVTRGAFSLLELLVTVAIILILTTMYWGSNSPSRRQQQKAACQKNLQSLYIAMQIFANDHNKSFPDTAGARTAEEALDELVPRYTADTSIFICPASKDSSLPAGESILKRRISYAYYMGRRNDSTEALLSDRQVDGQAKMAGQYTFSTTGKGPGSNHGKSGGNFLFCDGRVEWNPAQVPFSIVLTQGVVLLNPRR